MHFPPRANHTESLDDVVRRATNGPSGICSSSSGGGGAVSFTSLLPSSVVDGVSTAAVVSRLAAQGGSSAAVASTPTVRAIRWICDRYLETYEKTEELARDTTWWSREAARLRAAHIEGKSQLHVPCEAPFAKGRGWNELMRRAFDVMESSHHTAAVAWQEEDTRSPSSLSSSKEKTNMSGEVNVLQFESDLQPGVWESLEILDTSTPGGAVSAAMRRDEECLRTLEAAIRSPTNHLFDETEQLDSLRYLLKHRPELIVQHESFADLQRIVVDRVCLSEGGCWTETALSLFQALPPRAQLDFVYAVVSAVRSLAGAEEELSAIPVGFLHRLLVELPQGWLPLLDHEVTDVFVRVLTDVVVPFGKSLSNVDPHATWLALWWARPSLSLSVETILKSHRSVVDDIAAQLPSPHAACVLLWLLPQLSECGEAQSLSAFSSLQSWQELYHTLLRLLCEPVWRDSGVYLVGAPALCRCAGSLSPTDKGSCLEVTSKVVLGWDPAVASPVDDAQFSFALRLIATLLTSSGEKAMWCSTHMWGLLDGPLFAKSQELLITRGRQLTSPHVSFRTVTLEVSDVVRECWTRLLEVHTPNLPNTLASVINDVWGSGGSFRWSELVWISTTVAGWAAIKPYVEAFRDDVTRSPPHWEELLNAIVEVGGGALDTTSKFWACPTTSRLPVEKREPCGSGCVRSLTPYGVALLLRWSTCTAARDGLAEAARNASRALLRLSPHTVGRRMTWPLLWPVEVYPQVGGSDVFFSEDAFSVARAARAGVCYQSIYLLLESTALPAGGRTGRCDSSREPLENIWGQVADLWLDPAQLTQDSASNDDSSAGTINRPPFGEESLLTLISSMALCVLVRPSAEFRMWFDPAVAQQRIRQLRRLCEERRGVDPIYFMVRFITSGKGRKRLPAILLDGFEAQLTIDTVCDVDNFAEGEALPIGDITAVTSTEEEEEEVRQLQLHTLHVLSGLDPSACETKVPAPFPTRLSETLAAVIRTLLVNRTSLRLTWQDIEKCIVRRSAEEWALYANTDARVLAVCEQLEQHHSASILLMSSAHVDVVFLVSLCLRSWLALSTTHTTPARRKLYWTALQYFTEHGILAFDVLLARSIALHVERALRESAAFDNGAVIFPVSRSIPLPSALFSFLLVRPFSLAPT
ncbi:hypothetical protein JKF63_03443 [Porcisia hertigi]|uniref:Uncharacterized protein n=1 Tax=Porcisia hertigi TaxID=2761500 RepID=A0A836ILD2_9TRYP|nr:hypothetical protein JKF63_03443 [Porcisia hertigi]